MPRSCRGNSRPVATDAEIAAAAAELAHVVGSDAVLVTRSEEGISLHVEGQTPIHIPAYPVKVRDVSGAGDTVAAVLAVLLAMKTPYDSPCVRPMPRRRSSSANAAHRRCRLPNCVTAFSPAASLAPEDKIIFDWSMLDRTDRRMAAAWLARRIHQRMLRSSASRPRQIARRGARGLRSPRCWSQQRCFDGAAEGKRQTDQSRRGPGRGACRPRGGRSGGGF